MSCSISSNPFFLSLFALKLNEILSFPRKMQNEKQGDTNLKMEKKNKQTNIHRSQTVDLYWTMYLFSFFFVYNYRISCPILRIIFWISSFFLLRFTNVTIQFHISKSVWSWKQNRGKYQCSTAYKSFCFSICLNLQIINVRVFLREKRAE